MKTERRHELQTNELAQWLAGWIEKITPYSRVILGCLVLGVAAFLALAFVNGQRENAQQESWTRYFREFQAQNVEGLAEVATEFEGTKAGLWAQQAAADLRLANAVGEQYRDPEAARELLEQAREEYRAVAEKAPDSMLKQRALFGLAQSLESLGDIDGSLKQYEAVISVDPESTVGKLAASRSKVVSRPETKDWYAWFVQQKPVESPLSAPGLFQNLQDLPATPDINTPGAGEFLTPDGSAPTDSLPDLNAPESTTVEPTTGDATEVPEAEAAEPAGTESEE